MSEFELRRHLQNLAREREPSRDLWPGIAARLSPAAPAPRVTRFRAWPEALAASLVVALGLGLLNFGGFGAAPRTSDRVAETPRPSENWARREAEVLDASYRAAIAEARGGRDAPLPPAIRDAVAELDAAQNDLESALERSPGSTHLLNLLRHTHEQKLRLTLRASTVS